LAVFFCWAILTCCCCCSCEILHWVKQRGNTYSVSYALLVDTPARYSQPRLSILSVLPASPCMAILLCQRSLFLAWLSPAYLPCHVTIDCRGMDRCGALSGASTRRFLSSTPFLSRVIDTFICAIDIFSCQAIDTFSFHIIDTFSCQAIDTFSCQAIDTFSFHIIDAFLVIPSIPFLAVQIERLKRCEYLKESEVKQLFFSCSVVGSFLVPLLVSGWFGF